MQVFHAILAGGGISAAYTAINQAIYFIAGIFDMLNVACKPLQQLKTLAVLTALAELHLTRTSYSLPCQLATSMLPWRCESSSEPLPSLP